MSTLKVEKIQHPNSASVALTLDTSGYLALQAGSASTPAIQGPSDPNTGIFFPAADTIAFAEGGTEVLRIDSSGRVGIGVSSISSILHINSGAGTDTNVRLQIGGAGSHAKHTYSDATNTVQWTSGYRSSTNTFGINVGDSFNSTGLTIDSSGRLGIGTTSPATPLHVNSGAISTGARLESSSTGAYLNFANSSGNSVYIGASTSAFYVETGGSERARIDSSGRLGIGTSSPGYPLSVKTTTDGGQAIFDLDNLDVGNYGGLRVHLGKIDRECRLEATYSTSFFSFYTDGAERLRIDSAGNLISPPTYAGTTSNAANVNIQPDGRLYRSTSSIKYKTNVETIEDQYSDALLGCRPVWYQSICEADNPNWGYWGFIAEEVAAIDPRLCFFKEEKDGTLEPEGVQYDRFVPHLLNLIKRQQQAIENLQAEVTALKTQ